MLGIRKKCINIIENSSLGILKAIMYIGASLFGTKESRHTFGVFYNIFRIRNRHNYSKLKEVKNKHDNQRCFIIGTGPSLTLADLEKLKNEITFGSNTLLKIYDKTDWRSTYYCIIDPNTYSNLEGEINEIDSRSMFYPNNRIMNDNVKGNCFALNHSNVYRRYLSPIIKFTRFSDDIEKQVYDGASVIYAAMQIAVYMGIKEIYLLGVDCNYSINNTKHAEGMSYTNYQYKWTEDTALSMIEGFKIAKKYANKHGIKIYNASRGGMLEVFERVNLDEVLLNG